MKQTNTEYATALGIKEDELVSVSHNEAAGTVIETRDGARYVDVPEDRPDANGATGLMYLDTPDGYTGAFPVYATEAEESEALDAVDAGGAPVEPLQVPHDGSEPVVVPDGSVDEVLSWVGDDVVRAQQAHDLEEESVSPRKTLVTELKRVIAANPVVPPPTPAG